MDGTEPTPMLTLRANEGDLAFTLDQVTWFPICSLESMLPATREITRQEAAQVLRRALEIITAGWTKGKSFDLQGNYCLSGAIGVAIEDRSQQGERIAFQVLVETILAKAAELFPPPAEMTMTDKWFSIPAFNDHPDITLEDVLLVGKHALEALEAPVE